MAFITEELSFIWGTKKNCHENVSLLADTRSSRATCMHRAWCCIRTSIECMHFVATQNRSRCGLLFLPH